MSSIKVKFRQSGDAARVGTVIYQVVCGGSTRLYQTGYKIYPGIYQRLNGYDGNGNECEFSESQKEVMRGALRDLARKLNETADKI